MFNSNITMFLIITLGLASHLSLADPTRPPGWMKHVYTSKAASSKGPVLQQILLKEKHKLAIIDGEIYHLGESKGGIKLLSVNKGSVKVRTASGVKKLSLVSVTGVKKYE